MAKLMILNVGRFLICSTGEEIKIPDPADSYEVAIKLRDNLNADDEDETWEVVAEVVNFDDGGTCPTSIHPNQRPLQLLGKRLAELLDEDQFAECEALLLEAGVVPPNVELRGSALLRSPG